MSVRRFKAKLTIFFTLCLLALAGWAFNKYRQLPDQRLIGTWKVDAEATLKDWNSRAAMSDSRSRFWQDTWRDEEVTYYKDRYVTQFRAKATRQFFSTRARGKSEVVIRETVDGKTTDVAIHFEGPDRIWLPFADGDDHRQYFIRATKGEDFTPQRASTSPGLAAIGVE